MATEPRALQRRPHFHGMPIPQSVQIIDGTPDFTKIDWEATEALGRRRCCGLCGERMGDTVAFIGGPAVAASGRFNDGPMHEACARYASEVCPFVSGSKAAYRKDETFDAPRPPEMFIIVGKRYSVQAGDPMFQLHQPFRAYPVATSDGS